MGNISERWLQKYNLAKTYYEHYGNLNIPCKFKTINGYEYDDKGKKLGIWLLNQKAAYKGKSTYKITNEQKKLLQEIGISPGKTKEEKWTEKYELAKLYYEHHGNLNIPYKFKTTNGYEYDESGIDIWKWIMNQKTSLKNQEVTLKTKERINLLEEIGMNFENLNATRWERNYELAKIYYEHHSHLNIPYNFKTINGYEYDENGINIGMWIANQKTSLKNQEVTLKTKERIKLFEEIGMNFENLNTTKWEMNYNLAKLYYEHHGNLNIPCKFKTINGYEYDESGIDIGKWIMNQKTSLKNQEVTLKTKERIKLFEEIGMNFENLNATRWERNYELAKIYYEHHGHLDIPHNFNTTNGFEYDYNGINLGKWILNQKIKFNKKKKGITKEQIKLLKEIRMNFNSLNGSPWEEKYRLAKIYYKHYGNLNIPYDFKTVNGYEYDDNGLEIGNWISNKKIEYKGYGETLITEEQVKLLEEIGIKWFYNEIFDLKRQEEVINNSNSREKQIEILNRVRSLLNTYQEDFLPSKEEINKALVKQLDIKR